MNEQVELIKHHDRSLINSRKKVFDKLDNVGAKTFYLKLGEVNHENNNKYFNANHYKLKDEIKICFYGVNKDNYLI